LRRNSPAHGPARLVHNLICDLFMRLLWLLVSHAEQVGTDRLPDPAPAPQGAHHRDPRPWQSGRPEHRPPEAASGAGTLHALFEPPEIPPKIKQPIAEAPQLDRIVRPPCRMPRVELPAAPPPARPRHMDHGCWPRWRGPGVLWTTQAGFLRLDSKKRVCAGGHYCAHFVTI
jgi:hypothetical protein